MRNPKALAEAIEAGIITVNHDNPCPRPECDEPLLEPIAFNAVSRYDGQHICEDCRRVDPLRNAFIEAFRQLKEKVNAVDESIPETFDLDVWCKDNDGYVPAYHKVCEAHAAYMYAKHLEIPDDREVWPSWG